LAITAIQLVGMVKGLILRLKAAHCGNSGATFGHIRAISGRPRICSEGGVEEGSTQFLIVEYDNAEASFRYGATMPSDEPEFCRFDSISC
jgi:hypothetical protein